PDADKTPHNKVYVYPYCGEFYLHQDWSCLMAVEISREAWIRIDMEVHPSEYLELSGGVEDFTVVFANGEKRFQLIDREREIYRRGGAYMIPVRRIHDFKMIAYCGNGDGQIFPFVKFAWKSH
ncbi:MAG: hypothetical protein K2O69_03360, partial [Odoribacter sp.]|nr:hypothetical protein [Odoribacter sp.]